MKGINVSAATLKKNLADWLDLALKQKIPYSLLVLSRAFVITQQDEPTEALKEAVVSLADKLESEVEEHKVLTNEARLEQFKKESAQLEQESPTDVRSTIIKKKKKKKV